MEIDLKENNQVQVMELGDINLNAESDLHPHLAWRLVSL